MIINFENSNMTIRFEAELHAEISQLTTLERMLQINKGLVVMNRGYKYLEPMILYNAKDQVAGLEIKCIIEEKK